MQKRNNRLTFAVIQWREHNQGGLWSRALIVLKKLSIQCIDILFSISIISIRYIDMWPYNGKARANLFPALDSDWTRSTASCQIWSISLRRIFTKLIVNFSSFISGLPHYIYTLSIALQKESAAIHHFVYFANIMAAPTCRERAANSLSTL